MSRSSDEREWEALMGRMVEPPDVPRERMWRVIDEARQDKRRIVVLPSSRGRIWRLASGIAAILVLGIAIGRMTVEAPAPVAIEQGRPSGAKPRAEVARETFRFAAANLFGRADYLLTDFKVSTCSQEDMGQVPDWAGSMLLQTRLLMDTPAADDAEIRKLLEDLELVLAQIASLSRDHCARDRAWIKQGLQERSTLDRLRMKSAADRPGVL